MKINIDKVVVVGAGISAAVLTVLVNDGVITSKLAADIGTAIATFITGYHIQSGRTVPSTPPAEPPAPTPDSQSPQA